MSVRTESLPEFRCLTVDEAQAWFEAMPAPYRIVSLSPRFAVADATRDPVLLPHHCGLETPDGQRWLTNVHVMPFAGGAAKGLISPYGYGGPLSTGMTSGFNVMARSAWDNFCRKQGWVAEFVRCHPMVETSAEALAGLTVINRQTVVVDLATDPVELQYNKSALAKIKACRKAGITVRWSRDIADWLAFGEFYRQAMRVMQAGSHYEFGDDYFLALAGIPGAEICIGQSPEDSAERGIWLTASVYLFGPEVVEYHLSASSDPGRKLGSASLVQHAAALRGQQSGARWLYLGGGTDTSPDNPLLFFKQCFSKQTRPFSIASWIHMPEEYSRLASAAGYDESSPPPRVLF